ncbi:MAG: TIGR03936 family radical SAM-associated protein [Clostridia bacterium]
MANKYVIRFSKTGYVKYTSHLDLLRMFKRAFKKAELGLAYSQGFNPHPKMGFAQPLSLGYAGRNELIEFETDRPHQTAEILRAMQGKMPQGIEISACYELSPKVKSLAAAADSAEYRIWILTEKSEPQLQEDLKKYLLQDEILAMKRMKKTKKEEPVNIKNMIRRVEISKAGDFAVLEVFLDCGSQSNCSPELVIASFCAFAQISTPRNMIEVERRNINFVNKLQF